ncbi:MAG: DUF3048 C-terminal domain-containing protein [Clostridia bacterium]|nr:DUF3048 C-terminal domain-containing protein [Clostridia bacterium]
MKKLSLLLALCMMLCAVASAETVTNATEDRGIVPKAVEAHLGVDGMSPTTGLLLVSREAPEGAQGLAVTGRYMPMLVQISNPISNTTKAAGTSNRAPWGVQYADLIYELPLHKNGETRMTALFSDVIPTSVGPIRSARAGHVYLREEWDCGFMFYGQSEYKEGNVPELFAALGTEAKGVLFSGIVGSAHPWRKFYERNFMKRSQPEDVNANAAEISKLVPDEHTAANHTFLFADTPYTGGDEASTVYVDWKRPGYDSEFRYDPETNTYGRYVTTEKRKAEPVRWVELLSEETLDFANVIVQWTPTEFIRVDIPVTCNVAVMGHSGEGNAEIFMSGRHISGYWKREGMNTRTVFYDENGDEVVMQRGRTMIVQLPLDRGCSYE